MVVEPRFTLRSGKAAAHSEAEVKDYLRPILGKFFHVKEEVAGRGPHGQKVKIDFCCYPTGPTHAMGWPDRGFGIEAKGWGLADQRKKTACRLLYQAIIYSQSVFPTDTCWTRPDLVLVYPTFAKLLFNESRPGVFGETFEDGYALALAKEGAMHRVGELVILPTNDVEVYAHGKHRWYSSRWGRGSVDYFGAEDNHASR